MISNFLKSFFISSVENMQNADLSYNSFLEGNEVGVNPDNTNFSNSSLDELSFIVDCSKNECFDYPDCLNFNSEEVS